MTVSVQIEPASGIAIVTCSGVLRLDDAREGAQSLWKSPGWLGKAAVWDFREAKFDISPSDVRKIAAFIIKSQPALPPARMAFVTKRDLDFGMARMFEVYREDPHTEFCVFRNYEEALIWARLLDPDDG